MDRLPSPQLINTYRVAAALKIVGTLTAFSTSKYLVDNWAIDRWGMSLLTGLILLALLLPWGKWFPHNLEKVTHLTLISALIFGIMAPHIDMIQSLWVPFLPLGNSPLFLQNLGWTREQVYSIHALGGLFVMVPVMLASWHYGRWGMLLSLGWAGMLYSITPFLLPPDSFPWLIYAVRGFVILGMTLILAFTTYTLAVAQRQKQDDLKEANDALAQANEALAQHAATVEQLAVSRERNRLARELHDTLAHSLSGTAVQLQAVSTLLKINPEEAKNEVKSAQQQIKKGLEEARRAIAALRASPIEELGLNEALRQRAINLAERSGMAVHCQLSEMGELAPHVEQALYRIADEALMNAEKYAQASHILLKLDQNSGGRSLTVQDNGVGFEADTVLNRPEKGNGRFGLIGMRERAHLIGAELKIDSAADQGTTIAVEWGNLKDEG